MNLTNTLNGLEYGYFLSIGLSSCPFSSSFILGDDSGKTECLSDMNVDIYMYKIHNFLNLLRYMYNNIHVDLYTCLKTYIYIYRERERDRYVCACTYTYMYMYSQVLYYSHTR